MKKKNNSKKKNRPYAKFLILGILLILLLAPTIIELISKEKVNTQVMYLEKNETMEFNSSSTYSLIPEVNGEIKSIKVTGKIIGDGNAKILFKDLVVFDSTETKSLATITGNSIEGNLTLEENETNETNQTEEENETIENNDIIEENSTSTNETIEYNETIEENETNETNQTEEENETIENNDIIEGANEAETKQEIEVESLEEDLQNFEEIYVLNLENEVQKDSKKEVPEEKLSEKLFNKVCKETCNLNNIKRETEYLLNIILEDGTKLIIEKIEYEINSEK